MSLYYLFLLILYYTACNSQPIWEEAQTSLPIPLSRFVVGSYAGNMYLVGGVTDEFGATPNANIYVLNITDGTSATMINTDNTAQWQNFSEFPAGTLCCFDTQFQGALTMHSTGYSQTDNMLFIVPYVSEAANKPAVLLIFDMDSKSFRSPNYQYLLPEPLSGPCVISTQSYVYLIGGVLYTPPAQIDWKNTFQIYNIPNDSWYRGPDLVIARRGSACSILGNNIYIFGGRAADGYLNTIERYNLLNQVAWQILSAAVLIKKKDEALSAIVDIENNLIFLFGGSGNTSLIQVFDENDYSVHMFYLTDNGGHILEQKKRFAVILSNVDGNNATVLIMGGDRQTERSFIPTNVIYAAAITELSAYYLQQKRGESLQGIGNFNSIPSGKSINIIIQINLMTNKVYLTIDGPADRYFAIGFKAKTMSDRPYAIFVYGTAPAVGNGIAEHKLGTRGVGEVLAGPSMLTLQELTDYPTNINNNTVMYREVKLVRDRIGLTSDHFAFPSTESEIDVIYAHGSTASHALTYHFPTNRGSAKILFLDIACTVDGSVCSHPNVDYCCDARSSCAEVIQTNIDGVPTVDIACCIGNADDISQCHFDGECCGDYICDMATRGCVEPICFGDTHTCNAGDCCVRNESICAVKYDALFNAKRICCINSLNAGQCVGNGCCGVAQCDDVSGGSQTCRYDIGAPCSDDNECLFEAQCRNGTCQSIPTVNPSNIPTVNPSNIPTVNPSNIPTANPSNIPTANPSKSPPFPSTTPSKVPAKILSNNPTILPTYSPSTHPIKMYTTTTNPTSSPSNSPTSNIGEKVHETSQLYAPWYFVAATVLFVVLISIILIVIIVRLYKKNCTFIRKTSDTQMTRHERLESGEVELADGINPHREGEYGTVEYQLVENEDI